MNERDTPETYAFYATFADGLASPSQDEWLERLKRYERQRDGLLEAMEELLSASFRVPSHPVTSNQELRRMDIACRSAEAAIAAVREGKQP